MSLKLVCKNCECIYDPDIYEDLEYCSTRCEILDLRHILRKARDIIEHNIQWLKDVKKGEALLKKIERYINHD